jgi:hypothetical protein
MTDNIRSAIIALQNGNSSEFKAAISDSLMGRAMDAINIEKIAAGQAVFAEPNSDSYDPEIEELSDEEV